MADVGHNQRMWNKQLRTKGTNLPIKVPEKNMSFSLSYLHSDTSVESIDQQAEGVAVGPAGAEYTPVVLMADFYRGVWQLIQTATSATEESDLLLPRSHTAFHGALNPP